MQYTTSSNVCWKIKCPTFINMKVDGKYLMFILKENKHLRKKLSAQSFCFRLYYWVDSETFKIISLLM